jgi:hypothetical protein
MRQRIGLVRQIPREQTADANGVGDSDRPLPALSLLSRWSAISSRTHDSET